MITPRSCFFISLAVLLSLVASVKAQKDKTLNQFYSFANYYSKGDFINAKNCLIALTEQKEQLSEEYLVALYNNLGVINNLLGRYDDALKYLNLAESTIGINKQSSPELANIYINKARIYGIIKESRKAVDYLEQGIKIYLNVPKPDKSIFYILSTAYLNLGLTYFENKNYKLALHYLEKSKALKVRYDLSEKALAFLNLAKTYVEINDKAKAQKYFLECIESFDREFGKDYYRTSSVLFDYGLFLRSIGKNQEAFEIHKKALSICLKNYGEKHTFVSLAYKHLGDHFFIQNDYNTALQYYQKSLIAVVKNFSDTSIYSNPSLDSVIFDIRLLENLKRKAQALELLSFQQASQDKKQQVMVKGYETIDLALQLIGRIRRGYLSSESRIYLAENEKETYIFATHVAQELYELTRNPEYLQRMYSIACLSKSAVLRNEIAENEQRYRSGIPDSLNTTYSKLMVNIASYSKLIQDELQRTKPDAQKIDFWKEALFGMNRSKEKLDENIKGFFPQHESLIQKTESASLTEIQNRLKKDETLVEYFLSNQYSKGKRELYTFIITRNRLDFCLTYLDSLFAKHVEFIKQGTITSQPINTSYKSYTDALYSMYEQLVQPVESKLAGNKLIIVPDEEIAYLPFDAFIREKADTSRASFEDLKYLIYDYTISYGYASSLIFRKERGGVKTSRVYTFSPDYKSFKKGVAVSLTALPGAAREIESIFKWFDGDAYSGGRATESNFKRLIGQPAIFHLAMHSQTDSANSKYSYLIFDPQSDTIDDGKLYNYEISMNRIESPMVVLSACNTGAGNLYHGEGLMSLTRGFILAGASSVVNTFWDANDGASADIMRDFYYQLSKGEEKDVALRMAKLKYLKVTPPVYLDPYYWAAYEIMGDKSPIKSKNTIYLLLLGAVLVISGVLYFGYSKRFRRS